MGEQKHHLFRRQSVLVPLSSIVVITVLSAVLLQVQSPNHVRLAQTNPSQPQAGVLGATVQADTYSISAKTIRSWPVDETRQTMRISVAVTITNSGNDDLQISPGLQMFMVDSTGKNYGITTRYLPVGKIVGGALETGKTRTENIDFDISSSAAPAYITFQLNAESSTAKVGL